MNNEWKMSCESWRANHPPQPTLVVFNEILIKLKDKQSKASNPRLQNKNSRNSDCEFSALQFPCIGVRAPIVKDRDSETWAGKIWWVQLGILNSPIALDTLGL